MTPLARLEAELRGVQDGVDTCREFLEIEPGDPATIEGLAMFEQQVLDITAKIETEKAKQATNVPPPPPPPSSTDSAQPKFDLSKHPKFTKSAADGPPPPSSDDTLPTIFNVKDIVQAKYSGDKQWYQATIISKTGSASDPVYTVVFKGYDDHETKRKHEIRPLENPKKRKADGPPAAPDLQMPAVPKPSIHDGPVISAEPSIDKSLMQAKREPSRVSDGPTRMLPEKKKLKGGKALDRSKAKWNDFQKTGPKAKTAFNAPKAKESMFRTTDSPTTKGMLPRMIELIHVLTEQVGPRALQYRRLRKQHDRTGNTRRTPMMPTDTSFCLCAK